METVYKELMEELTSKVPDISWIDFDLGQIDLLIKSYLPLGLSVYISFPGIEWGTIGGNLQEGDSLVRLRISQDFYDDFNSKTPEDIRERGLLVFSILKKIHTVLQGFCGSNFNELDRVSTKHETNTDGLLVFSMFYRTLIRDNSAMPVSTTVMVTSTEVTAEID